ncbi:MAG: AbrB/MazE/SpoVT family DNA-binding domain-containing protein [Oscillospiraceae bacterium]|nr:AbrB/MazE/SpoVT family DNA-binding domain-containing protein [Oscillospiraceae bacterium]
MHSTGIFRRIDSLGRLVLPKELRKSLDLNQDDYLQIFLDGDAIVLKKSRLSCALCGSPDELTDFHEKKVCQQCLQELQAKV